MVKIISPEHWRKQGGQRMSTEWCFFDADYFNISVEQVDQRIENATLQAEFLIDVLDLNTADSILDLCCGYCRLAIPLARKGYNITAYDLCQTALDMARKKAQEHVMTQRLYSLDELIETVCDKFASWYKPNDTLHRLCAIN